MSYLKRAEKYLAKNITFNSAIHVLAGMGIGILITYPLVGAHPVRWGLIFLAVSALGHLWAATH